MNVLRKCSLRYLKKNRKRTIITVIGVALATMLITAVTCFGESARRAMVDYSKMEYGDYHCYFQGVPADKKSLFDDYQHVKEYAVVRKEGYALFPDVRNAKYAARPYILVRSMDAHAMEQLGFRLCEGRLPEADDELVISKEMRILGNFRLRVGDMVTWNLGWRYLENDERDGVGLSEFETCHGFTDECFEEYYHVKISQEEETADYSNGEISKEEVSGHSHEDEEESEEEPEYFEKMGQKTYKIVGVIENPIDGLAPFPSSFYTFYSAFTYLDEVQEGDFLDLFIRYDDYGISHADDLTASILGISSDRVKEINMGAIPNQQELESMSLVAHGWHENANLLKMEKMSFSNLDFWASIGFESIFMFVIVVISLLCIQNCFDLSLAEKVSFYGQLASIGATKRQRRKIVFHEAAHIGFYGILFGVIAGVLGSFLVILASRETLAEFDIKLDFVLSIPAVLIAIAISGLTVFLAAMESARLAAKVTPIRAISQNDLVKRRKREPKAPGMIKKCFGVSGVISWKNQKRARSKYRPVTISIFMGVFLCIGAAELSHYVQNIDTYFYQDYDDQLDVWTDHEKGYENLLEFANMDGVEEFLINSILHMKIDPKQISYVNSDFHCMWDEEVLEVRMLEDSCMKRYCETLGVSYEETDDKVIVKNKYRRWQQQGDHVVATVVDIAEILPGDIITGEFGLFYDGKWEDNYGVPAQMEVLAAAGDVCPRYASYDRGESGLTIYVSQRYVKKHFGEEVEPLRSALYLRANDVDAIEKAILDSGLDLVALVNREMELRRLEGLLKLILLAIYAFLAVCILIGMTNLINTLNANMENRKKEISMLRSMGMSDSELRKMLIFEELYLGGKALIPAIIIGCAASFALHKGLWYGSYFVCPYQLPILSIVLSIVIVFGTLHVSMQGKVKELQKENMMELLRREYF